MVCRQAASHPARGAWIEMSSSSTSTKPSGSHPARGAWIEICTTQCRSLNASGRTPQGVRGLKFQHISPPYFLSSRTPQGVRGLKSIELHRQIGGHWSHPARGAWIEISWSPCPRLARLSHPARGAWIEMVVSSRLRPLVHVAPRKGCVD